MEDSRVTFAIEISPPGENRLGVTVGNKLQNNDILYVNTQSFVTTKDEIVYTTKTNYFKQKLLYWENRR